MKRKIIFLINPNGYGHLFRIIDLIYFLIKKKIKIKIYCSSDHKKKIENEFKFKIDTEIFHSKNDLKKSPFKNLKELAEKKIILDSDLKNYNHIISDNLINLNIPISKFFLMANFMWSETDTNSTIARNEYLKIEKKFLNQYKKKIICNKFFRTKKITKYKNLPIDFTGNKMKQASFNNKIFFYYSQGDYVPLNLLLKLKKNKFDIFSNMKFKNKEIKFINTNKNKNFLKDKTFIIAKPGLGIIKDIIRYKKYFFTIFKKKNFEYTNNFLKLKKFKLTLQKKYDNEKEILETILKLKITRKNYKNINFKIFKFDGAKKIYKYVINEK